MIAVDTSALVEIALKGPQAFGCRQALLDADRVIISAGTVTEALIVSIGRQAEPQMTAILDRFGLIVVPLTEERAKAAGEAYRRYGKRFHAAALNFGDCFAYALARENDCPLLYVGKDFAVTDIRSALA